MCIIAHRPANCEPLPEANWRECWKRHSDGAGFMYFDEEGKLQIDKGFMAFDPLYEEIKLLEQRKLEFVVHFRTASPHMVVNAANTHPFTFAGKTFLNKEKKPRFHWAVVHNGRLPWNGTQHESDTARFCKEVLFPIFDQNPWCLDNETIVLLQLAVTNEQFKNKLVIMRWDSQENTRETYIINKHHGNEAHGGWFSNRTWETWDSYRQYHGYGGMAMGHVNDPREEFMKKCVNGYVWSWKFDCWLNYDKKTYTDHLYYRDTPYDVSKMAYKASPPQGWKYEWIEKPKETAGDKAEKNKDEPRQLSLRASVEGNIITLDHLSGDEKELLCKEAVKVLNESGFGKAQIKKMSNAEKVDWLRDGVRAIFPECETLPDIDLDMWMLKIIKDGKFSSRLDEALKSSQMSN